VQFLKSKSYSKDVSYSYKVFEEKAFSSEQFISIEEAKHQIVGLI